MEMMGWVIAICVLGFVITLGIQERKKKLKADISSDIDDFLQMGVPIEHIQQAAYTRFKWRRLSETRKRTEFPKMLETLKIDEQRLRRLLKYYDR